MTKIRRPNDDDQDRCTTNADGLSGGSLRCSHKKVPFLLTVLAVVLSFAAAAVAAPPRVLLVRPRTESVGMYEKVELVIELEAEFANPFDPEEIDLQVEFSVAFRRDSPRVGILQSDNGR